MMHPSRTPPAAIDLIPEWLDNWRFHFFVTLSTNDADMGSRSSVGSNERYSYLRDRLREFDARMNRQLLGREWQRSPDRMFGFWFLEKPDVNPHWHGLVRFFASGDMDKLALQKAVFQREALKIWTELVPSGEVDIQLIADQPYVSKYVVKSLGHDVNYSNFVVPDQFAR
jgi:hypothetical protein